MSKEVEAIVCAEVEMVCNAEHGKYVRTFAPSYGSVTFSLHQNVWKGCTNPSIGEIVILAQFRYMKGKGWRAESARRPTVEEIREYLKD